MMLLKNKTKRRIGNKSGSFLLETILAVVIISISLTLISQSLSASLRANLYVSGYSQAVLLAENKLFELRSKSPVAEISNQTGLFEEPFDQFGYEVMITSRKDSEETDDIREAAVTVTWDQGRKPKALKAATLLYPIAKMETDREP